MKKCPHCEKDFDRYAIELDLVRYSKNTTQGNYMKSFELINFEAKDLNISNRTFMTLKCPNCNTILKITNYP